MSKVYDAIKRAEQEREASRERTTGETPRATRAQTAAARDEEDYRRLRANLLFTPGYAELHSILVTSTRHGEGATRVAVGLARALAAEQGTRVLLLEANLRTPALNKQLPLSNGLGLSDVLAGEVNIEAAVQRLDELNLSVVPAGSRVATIDCEAIAAAVTQLQSQFDFVILDTPPVNRYADVAALAPKMDGVILVVEADKTPVAEAESAKRNLDRVGARLFGVVLNRRRSYIPAFLQALL
jgi:capsular exopolysaccharide synthesis family protein